MLGCGLKKMLNNKTDKIGPILHKSRFIRSIGNAGIYLEIFNILGINNVSSYTWFTDINGIQNAVPDYLTPRLINLKFAVDF